MGEQENKAVVSKEDPESKRTASYVEEVFRLINTKPEIHDVVILNKIGNPVKTTMEMQKCLAFAGMLETLMEKLTSAMQELTPNDEVSMFRIRTHHNETFIVPDGKITVIVVQSAIDRIPTKVVIR